MKYLTDTEILKWNDRLSNMPNKYGNIISVYPKSNMNSNPYILYKSKTSYGGFKDIPEPTIDFTFIFSVSSNRLEEFLDILNSSFKEEFVTKSVFLDLEKRVDRVSDIIINESIIKSKKESKHKISEREYTRYIYNFSGKLGSIIGYVSYIEDAVNFLSLMWEYSEKGSEISLLKYPIGSIVSKKEDQSLDFLVLDYKYYKIVNDYKISYVTAEIKENNGIIIKYGNVTTFSEDKITWSRNNRIDNILDN
jgi:hypothetical protein